nr:phosphoribosyltransferase family protein [Bacillus sp. FJAT-47783]
MFHDPLNEARKRYFPESTYVTLPIPLSQQRLYERGFNQALLLSQQLHLPIIEPLEKIDLKKQSKKSRNERIHSKNMFTLTKPELVKDQHIIIIDDIYTTGTTIRHAAKLLHQAGASTVQSLTLIRS